MRRAYGLPQNNYNLQNFCIAARITLRNALYCIRIVFVLRLCYSRATNAIRMQYAMKQTVSLRLESDTLAKIDAKAQTLGLTRTAYMAQLIAADLGECNTGAIQAQCDANGNALGDAIAAALAALEGRVAALEKFEGAIVA